ncbi:hypothetical protein AV274_3140 [Blastocystis sp. ATCC 50177/Nand II]|uniref:Uncharacterized protein n=1 Tax=Blastocystis sp. subtype 1 (strain ATCC 50177 / NandII) TaxID=478820 RepID=A0A196SGR7_BLAHN|nr:hypothetical protein AV274_3140 [Blastocystis sp. ATCC 50177/Nand II]
MFPLGCSRSDCASCGAINYMASNMVPNVTRKALLVCPMCKASILYTIGCTHFQCSCGAVLEIPIPKYYIPCFGERK